MRQLVSLVLVGLLGVAAAGCGSLTAGIHRISLPDDPLVGSLPWLLYVDDAGEPAHVRDVTFDRTYPLRFSPGARLSEDVCEEAACDQRVERATGCLVATYEDYDGPPLPGNDVGRLLDGTYRACPGEMVEPSLSIIGGTEPLTALSEGRVLLRANYPLDPVADAVELGVDGSPIASSWSPGRDLTLGVVELPPLAPGAVLSGSYAGTRAAGFAVIATVFSTGAEVADLTFAAAPPPAAIDARGHPLVHDGVGTLRLEDDPTRRAPYAAALALGAPPPGATALRVAADEPGRFEGRTEMFLLRADGTRGPAGFLGDEEISLPAGTGAVWLVFANENVVRAPFLPNSDLLFALDEVSWIVP